ncbi:hypothetical protein LNQ81_13645 [Myroides sp. M-43]|uniref:hypothetical protein n=1 Tax=Myroides oncorhynchi TaxID=2893756 RepID=UPI001E321F6F|nr:hypothetical protein [Myroides oncorhynchi]MCC9043717.1 hypothetical protein [Myroides oncorhynchi]
MKERLHSYWKMNQWRLCIGGALIVVIVIIVYSILPESKLRDEKNVLTLVTATMAGIIAIYLGLVKQNLDDDKLFQELFLHFNSRYDNDLNDLFNELREEKDDQRELTKEERLLVIDYFNLCSEEYLWHIRGRLLPEVWNAWEQGIIANLKIPKVKELFDKECLNENSRKSYYGFIEYIEKKI